MHHACDIHGLQSWRRNLSSWFAILVLPMCASLSLRAATSPVPAKQIIAYIFPKDRVIVPGEIAARKLTRILLQSIDAGLYHDVPVSTETP